MEFVLFVEGHTEKKALGPFLKRWLDPRLPKRVGIRVVRFDGWSHYVDEIAKKVALNLSGKAGEAVIAGIGLLDLYGPNIYPNYVLTAAERYDWAKRDVEARVAHPNFRQHFAIHEIEAWLLAEPTILPPRVQSSLPARCANPEAVNFNEPPAALLARLYRSRSGSEYKKVIDGFALFNSLDPNAAYRKCPALQRLLDDMLTLASAALTA